MKIYILDENPIHSNKGQEFLFHYKCGNYRHIDFSFLANNYSSINNKIIVLPFQCEANESLSYYLQVLAKDNLVLAASGNNGGGAPIPYPATLPYVLSVGSHDELNRISIFNNTTIRDNGNPDTSDVYCLGKHTINNKEFNGSSYAVLYAAILLSNVNVTSHNHPTIREFILNTYTEKSCVWKRKKSQYKSCSSKKIISSPPKTIRPFSTKIHNNIDFQYDKHTNEVNVLLHTDDSSIHTTLKESITHALKNIDHIPAIPLSGGIDSEIVAMSCIESKLEFWPVVMRYHIDNKIMNEHDISHAIYFCKKNNIRPLYLDLDIQQFFTSGEYLFYAENYCCDSPQLLCHLWMVDQLKMPYIMAGDIPEMKNGMLACPPLKYFSYDLFNHKKSRNSISKLFWYNAAIISNILTLHQKVSAISDSYQRKVQLYRLGGYDIELRDRKKYTGFEYIKQWYDEKYDGIRTFNSLYRRPLEQRINTKMNFYYHKSFTIS